MSLSPEALWKLSDVELLAAYYDIRRQHVERSLHATRNAPGWTG
jgi:hypothetical protein